MFIPIWQVFSLHFFLHFGPGCTFLFYLLNCAFFSKISHEWDAFFCQFDRHHADNSINWNLLTFKHSLNREEPFTEFVRVLMSIKLIYVDFNPDFLITSIVPLRLHIWIPMWFIIHVIMPKAHMSRQFFPWIFLIKWNIIHSIFHSLLLHASSFFSISIF